MTKYLYLIFIALALISCKKNHETTTAPKQTNNSDQAHDTHNSKAALNWEGVYSGVLPCDDCKGIHMELQLNTDHSYKMKRVYLGKSNTIIKKSGHFKWSKDDHIIALNENEKNKPIRFNVNQNHLIYLDAEGDRDEDSISDGYFLQKH